MTVKQWYDMIGQKDSVFDVKDPEKFKNATAVILCSILHLDSAQKKDELQEFCSLLKKDAGVEGKKLDKAESLKLQNSVEEAAQIVKEQLEGDKIRMLEFMKMLNRFIMVDACKEEDYCIFEEIKEMLFDR